jgi:hypothetical protein
LGTDIENDVKSTFSSDDYQELVSIINGDISDEVSAMPHGTTASPYYIGGHFNLNIGIFQIYSAGFSAKDLAAFNTAFSGNGYGSDGVRQNATTGQAASLGYTLHSQEGKKKDPSDYSFHFDIYNPVDVVGGAGHIGKEVIWGHMGHHCFDPAWQ